MRTLLVYLFCAFTVSAVLGQKTKKQEKEEAMAQKVAQQVESQKYEIKVNSATPSRGRFVSLSSSYSVKISGDSIYSYLPFYGEAYVAPFGDDKGLIFDSTVQNYKVTKKKDLYEITFAVRANQDSYKYTLSISMSGYATVYVIPNNRSSISYNGELIFPEE